MAKRVSPCLGQHLEPGAVAIGIEDGGDDGAFLERFGGPGLWPANAEQDIGVLQHSTAIDDLGAGPGEGIVRNERPCPRTHLDGDLKSLLDETLDRVGGRRNAALARKSFGRDRDLHIEGP